MKEREVSVFLEDGIHARPAAMFVQTASGFQTTKVLIKRDDIEVNGKSIMNIMMLALTYGSKITIITDGEQEDEALDVLCGLFEKKFK